MTPSKPQGGLIRELAAERASKAGLSDQLGAALDRQKTLEAASSEARRDFAAELEMLRESLQRSEDRCEAAEKRALLDIDRERTNAARFQKDLVQIRQNQQEAEERHRTEIDQVQRNLGDARQSLGSAEGMIQELRAVNLRQADELRTLQTALTVLETEKKLQDQELETSRAKVISLESELRSAGPASRETSKPRRGKKLANS